MRLPTSYDDMMADYFAALALLATIKDGRRPMANDPHCGFFKMRAVKDGPWLPVSIILEQDLDGAGELVNPERMIAWVNGKRTLWGKQINPDDIWSYCGQFPIPEADYRFRVATGKWAEENAPNHPAANPLRPTKLSEQKPLF